jgi:hypothetical protein
LNRKVAQPNANEGTLDCRWFWQRRLLVGDFSARFQRWTSGNNRGIKTFSSHGRKMLLWREPLIEVGITSEAPAENFPL